MKWLTKSDYMKFLVHPAWLWLQKHDKDKLPPFDAAGEAVMEQGNEIEAYARELFPGGRLVEAEIFDMADKTKELIKSGATVLFQASVLTDRKLYCASDVWVRDPSTGSGQAGDAWDVYEVKSATREKPQYLLDLAFQRVAMEEAGYQVGRLFLIYIDNQYERQGGIDPSKLLKVVDVTGSVEPLIPGTLRNIEKAADVVSSKEMPSDNPLAAQDFRAWMDIYRYLHPEIPNASIYNICRLDKSLIGKLKRLGIDKITDVPENALAKPQQIAQVTAAKAGKPSIHKLKIARELGKLKFPIYFLDYETVFPGIPLYDGTRPYQQVPFQYSLHILTEDGQLTQKEFLARGTDSPMPELLKHLKVDLGPFGSVVSWNKAFEMGVNDGMAAHYPDAADFLKDVNHRMFDLMEIFSNQYYVDADFKGSASIKNVLPVLVKELSYKELGIQEGMTASLSWQGIAQGKTTGVDAQKIYDDLIEYCGLDTLAMVRIYQFLRELVGESPKAAEQALLF